MSRQALPTLDRTRYAPASGLARGAYVLADAPDGRPAVILIGTGSEVALCLNAYEELKKEGIAARAVFESSPNPSSPGNPLDLQSL